MTWKKESNDQVIIFTLRLGEWTLPYKGGIQKEVLFPRARTRVGYILKAWY